MVTNELNAPFPNRSMSIQSITFHGKIVSNCIRQRISACKDSLHEGCQWTFVYKPCSLKKISPAQNCGFFFLKHFNKPNNTLLRERKIAEIGVPFCISPISFSTSWISFKDEESLAFRHVSISCKSRWVKLVRFLPPWRLGSIVRSLVRHPHKFSIQLLDTLTCFATFSDQPRKKPVWISPPFLSSSSVIDAWKSAESGQYSSNNGKN